jgi:hypothetical protein
MKLLGVIFECFHQIISFDETTKNTLKFIHATINFKSKREVQEY